MGFERRPSFGSFPKVPSYDPHSPLFFPCTGATSTVALGIRGNTPNVKEALDDFCMEPLGLARSQHIEKAVRMAPGERFGDIAPKQGR
jgi:hypothetical protein